MTAVPGEYRTPRRLGIVVVNYGSCELLRANLRGVTAHQEDGIVVVVDNLSTARQREDVEALVSEEGWVGVYPEANLGFGGGMNVGVAAAVGAGATDLLLLNPDATIGADDVAALRAAVHRDPMQLVAPVVRRPDGTLWSAGSDLYLRTGLMRSRRRRTDTAGPTREWLSGACLMLTASLWRTVGGFSEAYFLYWEDVDLSHRVLDAGGSLRVVDEASAVHDEGATHRLERQLGKSATYYYYNTLNRLRYAVDHLPVRGRLQWLALAPWAARDILLQGGRRQLLRPVIPLGAVLRGTVAGGGLVVRSLLPSGSVRRGTTAAEPTDPPGRHLPVGPEP
ncbi:glycosyltransferase family 2 protein [Tersicoccus sp. MR15.9]|uniref:glycosyltransferase family 2 protein n=1 Tax=Tersicoccus mangrovi TaxID=3121635 RepID=UPI002FE64663